MLDEGTCIGLGQKLMHSALNEEVLFEPYQILSVAMATKTVVAEPGALLGH